MKRTFYITCLFAIFSFCTLPARAETLRQAAQYALYTNPDVMIYVAKCLERSEDFKGSKSGYLPTFDAAAGIGREQTNNATSRGMTTNEWLTLTRREASVELKQNLFLGFGTKNEIERQDARLSAAYFKTEGVANDIALEVATQYIAVLKRQELFFLARKNLEAHQRILGMIQKRNEAGLAKKAELLQAESRLQLAQANLIAEHSHLVDASTQYAKVVGRLPGVLIMPKTPERHIMPRDLRQAIDVGIHRHPTLESAFYNVSEAEAQHRASKSRFYPRLDFIASAARHKNTGGARGDDYDNLAMFRLNYNLFNGWGDQAKVHETAWEIEEARDIKNRTLREVQQTVRLSWSAMETAKNRIPHLKHRRMSALETVNAYREEYKLNQRTLLDLLDSENEYYTANIDYVEGLSDLILARYRILNSMGGLLHFLQLTVP